MTRVVNDPAVEARFPSQNTRPPGAAARLDSEPFKAIEAANTRIYNVPTLPTMSTFATDMAQLRAKGMQCYGIGPAVDLEDGPKGFGMHSDQERLLESELYRFVRFNYEVVLDLARATMSGRLRVQPSRVPRYGETGFVSLRAMVAARCRARAAQPPTFSGGNRTVAVYATVTDAGGRLVPDLGARPVRRSTTTASGRS